MTSSDQQSSLPLGSEIELQLTGIAHGGTAVARHEGRVVFVSDGVPGETVLARVTDSKKNFARASVTRVLEASSDRQEHVWHEASLEFDPEERAGGAEFGHIRLARQRELKGEVLADSLARFAHADVDADWTRVAAAPGDDEAGGLAYRTRVRLHVDPVTGEIGPYAARSNRVVRVESLPLAVPELQHLVPLDELFPGDAALDLVAPSADDPRTLIATAETVQQKPGSKRARGNAKRGRAARASIVINRPGEDDRVVERAGGREFLVRAGGFWQVHRQAAQLLFDVVRGQVAALAAEGAFDPEATNLDLYGGVGLFAAAMHAGATEAGAYAAGGAVRVTSVEQVETATDDAAENLAELTGALAVSGSTEQHLTNLLGAPAGARERVQRGTVVLDPPRSGAGPRVVAQLAQLAPANLIYVACDPVALSRDLGSLREAGYELTALSAHDIFPHTHHFETVATLRRG